MITKRKTSQAELNAIKRYQKKHKATTYRNQKKSRAKSFILKDATREELVYLKKLIDERLDSME